MVLLRNSRLWPTFLEWHSIPLSKSQHPNFNLSGYIWGMQCSGNGGCSNKNLCFFAFKWQKICQSSRLGHGHGTMSGPGMTGNLERYRQVDRCGIWLSKCRKDSPLEATGNKLKTSREQSQREIGWQFRWAHWTGWVFVCSLPTKRLPSGSSGSCRSSQWGQSSLSREQGTNSAPPSLVCSVTGVCGALPVSHSLFNSCLPLTPVLLPAEQSPASRENYRHLGKVKTHTPAQEEESRTVLANLIGYGYWVCLLYTQALKMTKGRIRQKPQRIFSGISAEVKAG